MKMFRKILSFRIMNRITVNLKSLPRTELHQRYLSWKFPRFLKVISKKKEKLHLNRQKKFNVSHRVTSIASIDAFIIIWRHVFMYLTWRVRSLLEYIFVKFQVFAIIRTENCSTIKELRHILPWKFECLSRVVFHNST